MRSLKRLAMWLQQLHRGYKVPFVMVAAWSPFLFAAHPGIAALVMVAGTSVFWLAVLPPTTPSTPALNSDPLDQGSQDVQA